MKKTLILLSIVLIASILPIHADTDTEIAPTIVVDYTVDPATLMPGDTGTVTITLFNGATNLSGVVVSIDAADGVTPRQPHPEYFIGELEADDFGSFELSVELDDGSIPSAHNRVQGREPGVHRAT